MNTKVNAYRNPTLPIEERIEALLSQMTVDEKVAQLNAAWSQELFEGSNFSYQKAKERIGEGIGEITRPAGSTSMNLREVAENNNRIQTFLKEHTRLGIPAIIHEECLSGLMARQANVFPQIIGLASSWDPEMIEEIGKVIADQIQATGAHQGLAPVLDVCRDIRWGRLEETFGEDPYLVAKLGNAYIMGMQSNGKVIATGKHFAAHGIPQAGLNWAPVHIGWRELHEVFLFPFEAAVKVARLGALMNAYHEIDGIPCASSVYLLKNILREGWGFTGIVVTDYNAIVMLVDYHHVAIDKGGAAKLALEAGIDIELPQTDCFGTPLLEAIRSGSVKIETINEAVRRVLRTKFRLNLFEQPFVDPSIALNSINKPEVRQLSHRAALESIVLLKNSGNILPLSRDLKTIAVLGPNADNPRAMLGDYSYGAFVELMDGGNFPEEVSKFPDRFPSPFTSILEAIRRDVSPQTTILYAKGCETQNPTTDGFDEAIHYAHLADATILVMGGISGLRPECTSGELRDRAFLGLPGIQEKFVQAILATGTTVILVIVDGRPSLSPEIVNQVPAILQAWLPGEEGGPAIAEIIFGKYNPVGKLPVTVPRKTSQLPIYYAHKPSAGKSYNYNDYVDLSVEPLFPFGHGISYTQFSYRDLTISPNRIEGNSTLEVRFFIKNVGKKDGTEVVQCYIRDCFAEVTRPVIELKGFGRVTLKPGKESMIRLKINAAQLAYYDTKMKFVLEPGTFDVMVGSSSADIRLQGQFEVVGKKRLIKQKVFSAEVEVNYL